MIKVTLTVAEMRYAKKMGLARHLSSVLKGSEDRYGLEKGFGEVDVNGACGELAFAKALGIDLMLTIDVPKEVPDVAGYQVRTTPYRRGHLIIRDDDRDDAKYALVTGVAPDFIVHGWIIGGEAKKRRDWYKKLDPDRPPSCCVPQYELNPVFPERRHLECSK